MGDHGFQDFLKPLEIDLKKIVQLSRNLEQTYQDLARYSQNQFLPTPISATLLRPEASVNGRYLAIDIGGTNLRVGFVELQGTVSTNGVIGNHKLRHPNGESSTSPVKRVLERSWPIGEHLKNEKAEDLFKWVGDCIVTVVEAGMRSLHLPSQLPLGITFSFPMIQHTLQEATLMAMGKGFAITSDLDLGKQLIEGYEHAARDRGLPQMKIAAIVNDAVATFLSFVYQLGSETGSKAAMSLIVGTGHNATIPMKLNMLHSAKRAKTNAVTGFEETAVDNDSIVVNCEWGINGTLPPLQEMGLVTRWDEALDRESELPGFMPFEQMSSGRYLGEIGRLIIFEYTTEVQGFPASSLPLGLHTRYGLTTTFLGRLGDEYTMQGHRDFASVAKCLEAELPAPTDKAANFAWTPPLAQFVYKVAKALQIRAAGMTAAAIIGLLTCAGDLDFRTRTGGQTQGRVSDVNQLVVGYTGGCIEHFQDYREDCQAYLDEIVAARSHGNSQPRVVLRACHDGGIIGAGVLASCAVER